MGCRRLRVSIAVLMLTLVAGVNAASAQDRDGDPTHPYAGPYGGLTAGLEFLKRGDESNFGFSFGAAAGYRVPVGERLVLGGYGLLAESTTKEVELSTNLNTSVAETWSVGGSIGYVFYSDYLVSLDIGYLETRITDAGPIILDPVSPGGGSADQTTDPAFTGSKSGARFALVFERPIASRLHTRSQISRTELSGVGQRWSFDIGLLVQF